jgi:hypothetical protein
MDLALLAVQAGSCLAGDVVVEPASDKPRKHKTPRGNPPRVGNVVQVQKMSFWNFVGTMERKTPVERGSPSNCSKLLSLHGVLPHEIKYSNIP